MSQLCKCDVLKPTQTNSHDASENTIQSILKEQETLSLLGSPYWYRNYIQSKRQEQLRCKTPSFLVRSSDENSDYEIEPAEKNISSLPTSSSSDDDKENSCPKSPQAKCNSSTSTSDDQQSKLQNTDLPDIIPIRRSITYPRLAPSRKIDNINIVLPLPANPLDRDVIKQASEVLPEKAHDRSRNFKLTVNQPTDDLMFYDRNSAKFLKELIDQPNALPSVAEWSMSSCGNTSSLMNSFTSDFDRHLFNILATSTPLSSSHALNMLVQEQQERRQNNRWINKIKTMVHNVPAHDRRKSQPPPIKINKDSSQISFGSTSSRFSNFVRLFRKISPKRNKKDTSMLFNEDLFQKTSSKRFSLDPQTIRNWNAR